MLTSIVLFRGVRYCCLFESLVFVFEKHSLHLMRRIIVLMKKTGLTMINSNINWIGLNDHQVVAQLGQELRRMRLERNLTQAEVAERTGLDRTTVVQLEAGRAATLLTVVQVLRAIGQLPLLDAFHQVPQPTPYMLVEAQEQYLKKQRKRASRKKPGIVPPKPKSTW